MHLKNQENELKQKLVLLDLSKNEILQKAPKVIEDIIGFLVLLHIITDEVEGHKVV